MITKILQFSEEKKKIKTTKQVCAWQDRCEIVAQQNTCDNTTQGGRRQLRIGRKLLNIFKLQGILNTDLVTTDADAYWKGQTLSLYYERFVRQKTNDHLRKAAVLFWES